MSQRVLLVEDDASLARSIVEGLSEEGFAVKHAADGDAAVEALRAGEWDLFILDWWLPIDFTPSLAGVFQNRCYRKPPGSSWCVRPRRRKAGRSDTPRSM